MTKTFVAQVANPGIGGQLTVPVKRMVELCGISGFVLHRPVNFTCDGTQNVGWIVSHAAIGLKVMTYPENTIQKAIAKAEENMQNAGLETAEKFQAYLDRLGGKK